MTCAKQEYTHNINNNKKIWLQPSHSRVIIIFWSVSLCTIAAGYVWAFIKLSNGKHQMTGVVRVTVFFCLWTLYMCALSRRKLIYQALLLWYVVAVLHCFSYSLSTAPAIWWWCCCCSCCVLHFFFARASALTDRLIRRLSGVRSTVHNSYRLFINNMLDIFVCIAVTRLPVCLCCVSNVHLFCHTAFFLPALPFPLVAAYF